MTLYVRGMTRETKKRLLLSKWGAPAEAVRYRFEEKLDEKDEQLVERDRRIEQMEAALERVKYWLHDGFLNERRRILQIVEDALQ